MSQICPNCGYKFKERENEEYKATTDIQKILLGWKILQNIPRNEYKNWDLAHFKRLSRPAKTLLNLFGIDGAIECMEFVYKHMTDKKLDCTLETIVKRSDLYREKLARIV